jgi:Bacterial Ig-like domain (group 3)
MRVKSRVRGAVVAVAVIASIGWGAFSQAGPAAAASGGAAASAGAAAEATPNGPGGTWGRALAVPGVDALATGATQSEDGFATAISCTSPGECTAVGSYSTYEQKTGITTSWPLVVSQSDGAWGQAAALPGIAALSSGRGGNLTEVSCTSAGNCAAAGSYNGADRTSFGFLADEVNGTWGAAQALPDAASLGAQGFGIPTAISCPSAGNCVAVGAEFGTPFLVDQVNGTWGDPLKVPGLASLGTPFDATGWSIRSLSCPAAGDCTAVGVAGTDTSRDEAAFLVTETDGIWGDATLVPGQAALSALQITWGDSVSCSAVGDCTAFGGYAPSSNSSLVWVADEVDDTWGPAQQLAVPATSIRVTGFLSCATPGNCAVEGTYADPASSHAFLADEVNGNWQASQDVPGLPATPSEADAISCPAPGDCTATGAYDISGRFQEYASAELNGVWSAASALPGLVPAAAELRGLSCSLPGYCSAIGDLDGRSLVTEANGTATTVTVAAAKVSYADEQTVPISVSVTSPAGDTPTGTVTVTTAPLNPAVTTCTVTLSAGTGKCTLPSTALAPGSYQLAAIYNGDTSDAASASATTAPLTVTPATTTTSLTLSATKAVYGHESVIRLSTLTTSQYGGPFTGRVTIENGSRAVCSFGVTAGRGSCLLPDTALVVGTSRLAAYADASNGGFASSVSASHAVAIVKGADTTTLTLSKAVVAFGHENATKLSVRVQTRYHGIPNGRVLIKLGSTTLGVFSSAQAVAGTWVLPARLLPPGTFSIVAVYEGNDAFAGSTSVRVSLKVT